MINYRIGEDYEWLATDGHGQVARFTTGGEGPIPEIVLARPEIVDAALDVLYKMHRTSQARLLIKLPRPDDFQRIAELGFFGYDWYDVHRVEKSRIGLYEPISVPSEPISAVTLPQAVQAAVNLVRLPEVTFGADTNIDIRTLVPCVLASQLQ